MKFHFQSHGYRCLDVQKKMMMRGTQRKIMQENGSMECEDNEGKNIVDSILV